MINLLKKIGYCINVGDSKSKKTKVFTAFQRHYRQSLVNGILDKECIKIAENLAKSS